MSATEFFFKHCDGKLTNEDFNEEGNKFAQSYYDEHNLYSLDYSGLFFDKMYLVSENEHDFDELSKLIEKRYKGFKVKGNPRNPWWKFWN